MAGLGALFFGERGFVFRQEVLRWFVVLGAGEAQPGYRLRPLGAGLLQQILGVAGLAGGLAFFCAEAEVVGRVVGVGLDIAEVELGDESALGGGGLHHVEALCA